MLQDFDNSIQTRLMRIMFAQGMHLRRVGPARRNGGGRVREWAVRVAPQSPGIGTYYPDGHVPPEEQF